MLIQSLLKSSFSKSQARSIERAQEEYTRLLGQAWRDSCSPQTVEHRLRQEKKRLASYVPFLNSLGDIARTKNAKTLVYPGAGLDLISATLTNLPRLILVDPDYSTEEPERLLLNRIRQLLSRCFDPKAKTKAEKRFLKVTFGFLGQQREVIFLPGTNQAIEQLATVVGQQRTVYLVKGTAQPSLLLPPPETAKIQVQAWGVDFPSPPPPGSPIVQMYCHELFKQPRERGEVRIYEKYLPAEGWLASHQTLPRTSGRQSDRLPSVHDAYR
jgi:hypothetical protein